MHYQDIPSLRVEMHIEGGKKTHSAIHSEGNTEKEMQLQTFEEMQKRLNHRQYNQSTNAGAKQLWAAYHDGYHPKISNIPSPPHHTAMPFGGIATPWPRKWLPLTYDNH